MSIWSRLILILFFAVASFAAQSSSQGTVAGKVENENEKPFSGVTVTAIGKSGTETKATTGSDGRFSLSLESGEYSITYTVSGYSTISVQLPVSVTSSKKAELKTVRMTKEIHVSKIRGKVYTEAGASLAGVTLILERTDEGKKLKLTRQTNSAGEFAFQLPGEPGHYRITASLKGFKPETKDIDVDTSEIRSMAFKLAK